MGVVDQKNASGIIHFSYRLARDTDPVYSVGLTMKREDEGSESLKGFWVRSGLLTIGRKSTKTKKDNEP